MSDQEVEAVAPVIVRVHHHGDVPVSWEVGIVSTHLVGHHPLRVTIPVANRDVEIAVVEENPSLGFLADRFSFMGLLLREAGDGMMALMRRFPSQSRNLSAS